MKFFDAQRNEVAFSTDEDRCLRAEMFEDIDGMHDTFKQECGEHAYDRRARWIQNAQRSAVFLRIAAACGQVNLPLLERTSDTIVAKACAWADNRSDWFFLDQDKELH